MNALIYGKRRQGKSTLALALAIAHHSRVVIFDPNDQFPLVASLPVALLDDWLRDHPADPQRLSLVRVGPLDTEEIPETFAAFSDVLFPYRDLSIIVDEAQMLQMVQSIDDNLDRWNRRSAESQLVIQTTHRIHDAHADSRYHADLVFFFYAHLPRELKAISDNFAPEVSEAVTALGPHQVVFFRRMTGGRVHWEIWPDGREWYINLENDNR